MFLIINEKMMTTIYSKQMYTKKSKQKLSKSQETQLYDTQLMCFSLINLQNTTGLC